MWVFYIIGRILGATFGKEESTIYFGFLARYFYKIQH
jgi:hypothetical protein